MNTFDIAAMIREYLTEPETLTTARPYPGTSSRTHNDICRSGRVKGARKVGRQWVCSRAAWEDARSSSPAMHAVTPSDIARADAWLAAAQGGAR